MDASTIGDDLNEVSVLVQVAHRLLVGLREDIDADPDHQGILGDLDAAHDELDRAIESIGTALDQVDQATATDRPREPRTPLH